MHLTIGTYMADLVFQCMELSFRYLFSLGERMRVTYTELRITSGIGRGGGLYCLAQS